MPRPENINSKNIKYLDIKNHNGHFETFFKSSNQWYNVSHDEGFISELDKSDFKHIDKIIVDIHNNPKQFRIFTPDEQNKFFNTSISPNIEYVVYDINMGRLIFYYGEDGKQITARQIAQNYTKIKKLLI